MRIAASLIPFVLPALVHALPTKVTRSLYERGINIFEDVLVFDGFGYPNRANPGNTLASIQAYAFIRQVDIGLVDLLIDALDVDFLNDVQTAKDRLLPFVTVGLSDQEVELEVPGCTQQAFVGPTSGFPDLGIALTTGMSLGQCDNRRQFEGQVDLDFIDTRDITATIFNSPDSGFGVISDIDDTVKDSHVLDKLALIKSTLVDEPIPVDGMPELYASLAKSLNDPQFVYISGSPSPLYPFLRDFISTSFSEARGPLILRNLTLVDIPGIIDFAGGDGVQEYKTEAVDRITAMYPNKRFLTIGDSTEKDPETYADAFRTHGDAIACIWIRKVDGADNSDERFATAFQGVPAERFRLFTDNEILSMKDINVAGGQC